MHRARLASAATAALATAVIACSPGPASTVAQACGGTYHDGSGRLGLAVLSTVRDGGGQGPGAPLEAVISDGTGTLSVAVYDRPGPGSYEAWWWPEVPVRNGEAYGLSAPGIVRAEFVVSTDVVLDVPAVSVAADASALSWSPIADAATYACRVYDADGLRLDALGSDTSCDLSALAPGAYRASVLAFSADPALLAAGDLQRPALPARFDVSEARLAFLRPASDAPAVTLVAAGGAIDAGTSTRGLAVWLSIRAADGTPTTSPWTVIVVGPSIPAETPVTFTYFASFPRQMVWSYDLPATPGTYTLTAASGATALATTFLVGAPPSLPYVWDATAVAKADGSARATWTGVEGARAYLVEVRDPASGAAIATQWSPGPPADLPAGTLASGASYDLVVAATDADMSGATIPTQVAVSEYPYLADRFTVP